MRNTIFNRVHEIKRSLLSATGTAVLLGLASLPSYAQNLVANPNFSSGNTGFTSSYTYQTDLTVAGTYYVGANPNTYHSAWASFGDHTTGTGLMMLLNGASTANTNLWAETGITVTPNSTYYFSTWITSVYPTSPAVFQFKINGGTLGGTFSPSSATPNWQQFYVSWNSGSNTSVSLALINQNTAAGGNDFALDDIAFVKSVNPGGTDVSPEPGSVALTLLGAAPLCGLIARRRRNK